MAGKEYLTVADAICRAVSLQWGEYADAPGFDPDMSEDEVREFIATSPAPSVMPEEDGFPFASPTAVDQYDWLKKPYKWFRLLDEEAQLGYLEHDALDSSIRGLELFKTLNGWILDAPPVQAGNGGAGKLPIYKEPSKLLLAHLEDQHNAPKTARFVALVLLLHMNQQTRQAYPSQETISKLTGYSVRSVYEALDWLKAHKVIHELKPYQYGGRYAPAVYTFTPATLKAIQWK